MLLQLLHEYSGTWYQILLQVLQIIDFTPQSVSVVLKPS